MAAIGAENHAQTREIRRFLQEELGVYDNDYGTAVERWKIALICRRARKKGFRPDEMADVQQQVALAVSDFQFDPDKANGASEKTALTALIDRQLSTLHRAKSRRERNLATKPLDPRDEESVTPAFSLDIEDTALALDVRQTVARLPIQDRHICSALADGQSIDEIAQSLECGWHTVKRRIDHIRQHFERIGLDAWLFN